VDEHGRSQEHPQSGGLPKQEDGKSQIILGETSELPRPAVSKSSTSEPFVRLEYPRVLRLIDVEQLRVKEITEKCSYVALSYVWGTSTDYLEACHCRLADTSHSHPCPPAIIIVLDIGIEYFPLVA
jgi:hypothetical protein